MRVLKTIDWLMIISENKSDDKVVSNSQKDEIR